MFLFTFSALLKVFISTPVKLAVKKKPINAAFTPGVWFCQPVLAIKTPMMEATTAAILRIKANEK